MLASHAGWKVMKPHLPFVRNILYRGFADYSSECISEMEIKIPFQSGTRFSLERQTGVKSPQICLHCMKKGVRKESHFVNDLQ